MVGKTIADIHSTNKEGLVRAKHGVAILLVLVLGGCASQRGSAPSGAAICTINAQQICEGAKDKPITLGIEQADQERLEENSPATMSIDVPLRLPNGDVRGRSALRSQQPHPQSDLHQGYQIPRE